MAIPKQKKELLKVLPDLMKGSLTLTSRSCGKASCRRCQSGGKHPIYFFGFWVKGEQRTVSIPAKFHKQVQKLINNWKHHKDLIEKLTDINVRLIRKGLFKEDKK